MPVPESLELSGVPVYRVADLPPKHGIDDLPMVARVERLLKATSL